MKVGAWRYLLKGSPKAIPGPRWKGVKGILAHLRLWVGDLVSYTYDGYLKVRHEHFGHTLHHSLIHVCALSHIPAEPNVRSIYLRGDRASNSPQAR